MGAYRVDQRINNAASLTGLLEAMREIQAECTESGIDPVTVYDIAALPTFGGPDIENTTEVWSWDATHALVGSCVDDMQIVSRQSGMTRGLADTQGDV